MPIDTLHQVWKDCEAHNRVVENFLMQLGSEVEVR